MLLLLRHFEAMISAEGELGHIFRRFYRVTTGPPREVRGVGLGLYICKCIIEVEL